MPEFGPIMTMIESVSLLPLDDFMGALTDTLVDAPGSWCNICDLYALHSPTYLGGEGQTSAERAERFAHCRTDPQILWWMRSIAPPDESLRIQESTCSVCAPGQVSIGGVCQLCPGDSITQGNSCVSCPPGQVANSSRTECIACAADEIVQGGQCVACPFGQGANAERTACVTCSVDEVIDYSVVEDSACVVSSITALESNPGDTCPALYVVDIINLAPPAGELAWVWLEPSSEGITEVQCTSLTGRLSVGDPAGNVGLINNTVSMSTSWVDYGDCPGFICEDDYCQGKQTIFVPAELLPSLGNSLRLAASVQDVDGPLPASLGVSDTTQGSVGQSCVRVR